MFRCQLCKCVAPPRTSPVRLVVERRKKKYPYRSHANYFTHNGHSHWRDDPGGEGEEIVKELVVCAECAAAFPQVVANQ